MLTITHSILPVKILKWHFLFLISCIIQLSCHTSEREKVVRIEKNFSEIQLDSNLLKQFLGLDSCQNYVSEEVQKFYRNRDFQYVWFSEGKLSELGPNFYNQLQNYMHDFGDSTLLDPKLDSIMSLDFDELEKLSQSKPIQERLEMKLTVSYFRYARNEFTGRVQNIRKLDWYIPKKKINFEELLNSLLEEEKEEKLPEPSNPYFLSLKQELKRYIQMEHSGLWPKFSNRQINHEANPNDSSIIQIKKVLLLGNDWAEKDSSMVYSESFKRAVLHFQNRMGLEENGKLDKATNAAFQVPIQKIIRKMLVNLERLRWLPDTISGDFLLVNIPEFKLHVFEDGKPAWQSNVVVGKAAGRTQIFRGNLSQIVLNPSWGIPPGIARKEVLPGIKRNISYLKKHDMEVYSGNTKVNPMRINWDKIGEHIPYNFRQKAGKDNPLGQFKFYLSNSFWIYLHDSNEKYLFDANKRALSHGCIRVEKARELAEYLLRKQKQWNTKRLDKMLLKVSDYGISLKPTVPVFIVYLTAWVNAKGELNLRNDVYKRDEILEKAVFGER